MSVLALFLAAALQAEPPVPTPGHWPQWRGPNRDNVSTETGLLREWPEAGPKLLWKADGLGEQVGGIAVGSGLVFLTGYKADAEYLTALDGKGKTVWSTQIGPLVGEMPVMRWLSQRTPTIDEDRIFAYTAQGVVRCLDAAGRLVWTTDLKREFGAVRARWGFCDFPLVDGDRLICTPGGATHTVVALNKKTGRMIWSCAIPNSKEGTHSGVVVAELAGVRQYVQHLDVGTVGISASDGKLLWTYPLDWGQGNVHTPILWTENRIFTLNGWAVGGALLAIEREGGQLKVVEKYKERYMLGAWLSSTLRVGDHLYAFSGNPICVELATGKTVQRGALKQGPITYADGRVYLRGAKGEVALVDCSPEGMKEISKFQMAPPKEYSWTSPVVAGGRLYLRDLGDLYCFDVRGPDYSEPPPVWKLAAELTRRKAPKNPGPAPKPATDAAFVATPQDVVERMLDEAHVTKDDVVIDLGSGDGRIVIAAHRKYGCKAVGIENDPELVRRSRAEIEKGKIQAGVRIEEKDLFTVDLSGMSVVTLYLGAPNNARLLPQLKKLKPGSRIVSHAHLLGDAGPKPDKEVRITSQEDGVEHTIYVWTTPLKEDRK
jgi:precorrin-6B methylase 2